MIIKERKVGILGLGHVGAHVAYSIAIQGIADHLVLVDLKESKVRSEVQDLRDAVMYMPHNVKIEAGTYTDLGDCDVIVNAIGDISLCASNNRLDEMNFTAAQVKFYMSKVMASGFNGIIINITIPVMLLLTLSISLVGCLKDMYSVLVLVLILLVLFLNWPCKLVLTINLSVLI